MKRSALGFCVLLGFLLLWPFSVYAAPVTFQWDASPSPDVAGYRLYLKAQGAPPTYTQLGPNIPGRNTLTTTVNVEIEGAEAYRVVAVAYDQRGNLSAYSNEATKDGVPFDFVDITPPVPPGMLQVLERIAQALESIAMYLSNRIDSWPKR